MPTGTRTLGRTPARRRTTAFSTPRRVRVVELVLAGLLVTACSGPAGGGSGDPSAGPGAATPVPSGADSAREAQAYDVYVAVGASETVGIGARQPSRQAWPRVLHDRALPGARYLNLGVSGSTVADALQEQLPLALAARPDVATVWLAVNDVVGLVPVRGYEDELGTLVHRLRRGGRTLVLVGNVPAIDRLPAYRACLPGASASGPPCLLPVVPRPGEVRRLVSAYNAAIARVVAREGARLVDLSGDRDLSRLTAADGFHPNTRGHRLVARLYGRALGDDGP